MLSKILKTTCMAGALTLSLAVQAGEFTLSSPDIFTVYALKLDRPMLPADATAALAGYMIHGNVIGKASFTAIYGR